MPPGPIVAAAPEAVYVSKTLSKVFAAVQARPSAVLVDLGPAIGSNILFLGERVGCKIHVGDLYADLDRHKRDGTLDRLPEFLGRRFPLSDGSVDAVLGWDLFDYLDPAAGDLARLTRQLVLRTRVNYSIFLTADRGIGIASHDTVRFVRFSLVSGYRSGLGARAATRRPLKLLPKRNPDAQYSSEFPQPRDGEAEGDLPSLP